MTYVMSDIHGEYDKLVEILNKIQLRPQDTLYVLGDIIDRGPHPIRCLRLLMSMPNAFCIAGNHEVMALDCIRFLLNEVTDESVDAISDQNIDDLMRWGVNGNSSTLDEFEALDPQMRQDVLDFIRDFLPYEELTAAGQKYLLVHAGLKNFSPKKPLDEYRLSELVWESPDYSRRYFKDIVIVSGHTPTLAIDGCEHPGFIYRTDGHIAIDCGACFAGGRLGCICLETGEEYYSQANAEI